MQVTNGQCQPFFPQGLGASGKPVPIRRAAQQQAGPSGAAVWARRASSAPAACWEQRRAVGRRPTG